MKTFLRLVALFVGILLFLVFYDQWILNKNLHKLHIGLSLLEESPSALDRELASHLIDQMLIDSVSQESLSLKTVLSLHYAFDVLKSAGPKRSLDDVRMMLVSLTEEEAADRLGILNSLDGFIAALDTQVFHHSLVFSKQMAEQVHVSSHPIPDQALSPVEKEAFHLLLQRSHQLQQIRVLAKAAEKKILALPAGHQRQQAAFRLACLLLRLSSPNKAVPFFEEITRDNAEGAFLLSALFKEAWCITSLGRFDEAFERLQEIIQKNPNSPWATAAYHQMASIYKKTGNNSTAVEIYEWLLKKSARDSSLSAILLAQIGCTYLFDLNDPPKAAISLHELHDRFLASPLNAVCQNLLQLKIIQDLPPPAPPVIIQLPKSATPPTLEKPKILNSTHFSLESATEVLVPIALQAYAEPLMYVAFSCLSATRSRHPNSSSGPIATAAVPPVESHEKSEASVLTVLPQNQELLLGLLENFLPVFVEVFSEQMNRYMEVVEEHELTRRYTEKEFQTHVVKRIQEKFPGQVTGVSAKIRPEGFVGSGMIRLGPLMLPVEAQIGIVVENERPHVQLHEIKVGMLPVPESFLREVETRVNSHIDAQRDMLKIQRFELKDGYALIAVERSEGGPRR